MVYAIISIGLLGFIVWSFYLLCTSILFIDCKAPQPLALGKVMALLCRETEVINFTIGWDVLKLLTTFYITNANNYNQSAGNSYPKIKRGSPETIRESSFELFRCSFEQYYSKPFKHNND